jgi:hypothetical protein
MAFTLKKALSMATQTNAALAAGRTVTRVMRHVPRGR